MTYIDKHITTLRREFKSRIGYALISATAIAIMLLIVKNSAMPLADEHISVAVVIAYVAATIVAHIVADCISYIFPGFEMRSITSWKGIFNEVLTVGLCGTALTYADMLTPGNTLVFDDSMQMPVWAYNFLLVVIAEAITVSFATSSVQRQKAQQVAKLCADMNAGIARHNIKYNGVQGSIVMDQIIKLDMMDGKSIEIAVCDMIYARYTGGNSVTVAYSSGTKTYHRRWEGNLDMLQHTFDNYPQITRCHRNYIVNTDRVTRVINSTTQCELQLRGTRNAIPMEGKYRADIYNILTAE